MGRPAVSASWRGRVQEASRGARAYSGAMLGTSRVARHDGARVWGAALSGTMSRGAGPWRSMADMAALMLWVVGGGRG